MSNIFYCQKIPDIPTGHMVIIDGNVNKTSTDFFSCIGNQLGFPDAENCNWDAYLDWMRDLSWIKAKNISIIVLNSDILLSEEPDKKSYFVSDLENVVFPFWKNDAESVYCDKNMIKEIKVYFLSEIFLKDECLSFKKIFLTISRMALNGQKTAHDISCPVLRIEDEKLYLASFVYFYNKKQLQAAMVNRPSMWILADLQTGEIVQRYSCAEKEFSESKYQKLYNISSNRAISVGKHFWHNTYLLMDLIRNEYKESNKINTKLYNEYLERIYKVTPDEFRVFYKDLNNICINNF